jgi:hypothetical protein
MSVYESNPYLHIEYNPCIRKGKHKPKHKKQKKYEAKLQKMNLIRSKNYKVIDNDSTTIVYAEHTLNTMLEVLKTIDIYNWTDDYENLYKNVYCLNEIDKYQSQYIALQRAIEENEYNTKWEEEMEDYRWERFYDRYSRWDWW